MTTMEDLERVLRDPETKEPIARATDAQLAAVRDAIAKKRARRKDGGELPKIEGGYVSHGGRWFYPDIEGIRSFLIEERIELDDPI